MLHSPGMLLALLSVAALWAVAAILLLAVFAAVSFDDFSDLALAAARAAVPAVWLVPALLFAQSHSKTEVAFGLVLLANAVRLLVATRPPHKLALKNAKPAARSERDTFTTQTLPIIGGAFFLQTGAAVVLAGHALVAAVLVSLGAAIVTLSAAPRPAPRTRSGAAATLIATIVLTILHFEAATTPALPKEAVTPLVGGIDKEDIKPLPGKDLVPGVILRPATKPPKLEAIVLAPASLRGILDSRPVVLPFTGEYHLFPTSSRHIQPDSTVLKGTPLDAAYISMSGSSIETEALQALNPLLDLTHCGKILLHLKTAERSPASAFMQLVTTTGTQELGTEIFGLEGAQKETLEFLVPALPANLRVKAIRVTFQRDPFHRTQSTKVAVESFTLLPRVL